MDTANFSFREAPMLYNPIDVKKSFGNPNTMYCFQKLVSSEPVKSRKIKTKIKSSSKSRSSKSR